MTANSLENLRWRSRDAQHYRVSHDCPASGRAVWCGFRQRTRTAPLCRLPDGLVGGSEKNVTGINAAFAQTTDPSCLNTWLTQGDWDVRALNRQRLAWPQRDPATRYAPSAIIPIDNTLVDHAGKLSEDVGYCWDHAEQRHKIAHHYLLVNSVCPSGTHYALELRRFRKRADCAAPVWNWQPGRAAGRGAGTAAGDFQDAPRVVVGVE